MPDLEWEIPGGAPAPAPSAPPLGPLRTLALEVGDVDLFPERVLRLHDGGQRWAARAALLEHAKTEPQAMRRQNQLRFAGELLLWADPTKSIPGLFTLNGFGTKLYTGRSAGQGVQVGLLWLVALFLPVVPLGAYVVRSEGDQWYFFGRIPIPRSAWIAPAAWMAGVAAVALPLALAPSVTRIAVYNGFDEPLQVTVGADTVEVGPHGHHTRTTTADELVLAAATREGQEIDRQQVDLGGHGGEVVVFNVASRGVLVQEWIRWGESSAPEPEPVLLREGSVQFLDAEYVFDQEPPETKYVSGSGYSQAAWVHEVPLLGSLVAEFTLLSLMVSPERGLALLEAERKLHPDNVEASELEYYARAQKDPADAVAFARRARDEHPDSVAFHRLYQTALQQDSEALRREYAELLAQHPQSPMYVYLDARLNEDRRVREERFRAALELDPSYGFAHFGLTYEASVSGQYERAAEHWEQARVDPAVLRTSGWIHYGERLAKVLARPLPEPGPVEGSDLLSLAELEALQARPEGLPGLLERARRGAEDPREHEATLMLVAGDVAGARERIRGFLQGPLVLRLALSDGATEGDRIEALRELGAPESWTSEQPVLAWALAVRADPDRAAAWTTALLGPLSLDGLLPKLVRDPRPEAVEAALEGLDLPVRGQVWAAIAASTADGPHASALRERARRFNLASEAPYFVVER